MNTKSLPGKVDDIQAVRKSSTDQCNSSGQLLFFCGSIKKTSIFPLQETPTLTISFFENRGLEWYSRSGIMSLFGKLILGVCLLHPIFLSDVLGDVIGVTTNYSADSALSNCQSNFA